MQKQIYRILFGILLLTGGFFAFRFISTTFQNSPPGGFTEAYFNPVDLNAALRDPECVKVRFYNARRTAQDKGGSVIMIGINADTTELTNASYKLYDRLSWGTASSISLSKDNAHACCMFFVTGQERFCVEFSRAAIDSMLACQFCNGIRLIPKRLTSGYWSMEMSPVKIFGSTATILTSIRAAVCSEPCPNVCGSKRKYINR